MVALIAPTSRPRTPVRKVAAHGPGVGRPQLRVIRGGLDGPAVDRSSWCAAGAVALVILAVLLLRIVQGEPPATGSIAATYGPSGEVAVADASLGEAMVVVAPGDTMWALAEALAPGRDPRPVVDILADRNGGTALRAGQRIVVPAELIAPSTEVSSDATLALANRLVADDS